MTKLLLILLLIGCRKADIPYKPTGNIGIGDGSQPTARLHIYAGHHTSNLTPMKFSPGVLLYISYKDSSDNTIIFKKDDE